MLPVRVSEQKDSICDNYANMLIVEVNTELGKVAIAGSSLRGKTNLVRVNDYWLELEPSGRYMLFTEHKDRPGMIGAVGTIIGAANINISQMQVSRGVHGVIEAATRQLQTIGAFSICRCCDCTSERKLDEHYKG